MDALTDTRLVTLSDGEVEVLDLPAAAGNEALAPLVLLHEGLGSVALWRRFPFALHASSGRRTVVWSRHGYGCSAVVTRPRGVDYMHREADRVLPELLAALDLHRPVLVGHSDGASIALLYAGRADARLAGVVALAPHVIVEDVSITGIEAARDAYLGTDLPRRIERYHRDGDATFWGWNRIWLDPSFRAWDITDRLPGIRCPVLTIQGREDEYGTLRQLDLIDAGVPGPVDRIVLDDCRHSPHLDQAEATHDAVVRFLAERVNDGRDGRAG